MSCWVILGIDRTNDLSLIKKAYAEAIKLHHPEDDPEGFQRVRIAYKEALRYANLQAHQYKWETEVKQEKDNKQENHVQQEKHIIQDEVNVQDSEKKQEENSNQNHENILDNDHNQDNDITYDFDALIKPCVDNQEEHINESNQYQYNNIAFQQLFQNGNVTKDEQIHNLIYNFEKGYQLYRSSASYWIKFFATPEFNNMKTDKDFTKQFLCALSLKNSFPPKMYNEIFIPMLQEWSSLWIGSEYEIKMRTLSVPKTRTDNKTAMEPGKYKINTNSTRIIAIIITIGFLKIISAFYPGNNDTTNYNIFTNTELGKDLDKIDINIPSYRVLAYVVKNADYDSDEEAFQYYQIDETEYNELLDMYNKQGIKAVTDYLDARDLEYKLSQ